MSSLGFVDDGGMCVGGVGGWGGQLVHAGMARHPCAPAPVPSAPLPCPAATTSLHTVIVNQPAASFLRRWWDMVVGGWVAGWLGG